MIVIASQLLCQQIISNSITNQKYKMYFSELNHVKYGLLSMDEWMRQITLILAKELRQIIPNFCRRTS